MAEYMFTLTVKPNGSEMRQFMYRARSKEAMREWLRRFLRQADGSEEDDVACDGFNVDYWEEKMHAIEEGQ